MSTLSLLHRATTTSAALNRHDDKVSDRHLRPHAVAPHGLTRRGPSGLAAHHLPAELADERPIGRARPQSGCSSSGGTRRWTRSARFCDATTFKECKAFYLPLTMAGTARECGEQPEKI